MSSDGLNLVVVSHGQMAVETLNTARQILGHCPGVQAISLRPDESLETAEASIRKALRTDDGWKDSIVLVDLFGGSCSNVAVRIWNAAEKEGARLRIVAGFNLAMLVEFSFIRESLTLDEAADKLLDAGRTACLDVGEKFRKMSQ